MKKMNKIPACIVLVISIMFIDIARAQTQKCGSVDLLKSEVRLPYWNDTTCINFFYNKKGKFKYNGSDYVPSTFISQIFFGDHREFKTNDSVVVKIDFNDQQMFRDVFDRFKPDQIQISDIRIECDNVLGYSEKWISILSVYLKQKE